MRATQNRSCRAVFPSVAALVVAALLLAAFAPAASAAPTIIFKGNGLDRFKFHGRVRLDPPTIGGPVDPVTTSFAMQLLNDFGVLWAARLVPGDLQPRANLWYVFKDAAALEGNGMRDGLFQVITRFREYGKGWYYTVRILAFTDLSAATDPHMTVVFDELDGKNYGVSGEWVPTRYGWRMPRSAFARIPRSMRHRHDALVVD